MHIEDDQIDTDVLELENEAVVAFEGDDDPDGQNEDEPEVVIAFSDDEQEEETPLVKKLRDQLREAQRQSRRVRNAPADDADPEPVVSERPRSVADFDYDEDRFNAALDDHIAAKEQHGEWKLRQSARDNARQATQDEQAKRVEQQRNALGVSDYDARSATVKDTLSDAQLAILINGADNPAQLIYALGRSQTRLGLLAGEDNLAKFAVMLGKMEKEIKVTKRSAPNPESQVRGATASLTQTEDKHLAKLEREADKSGDRSKVIAYRREQREKKAA
jgi:hypothetical protein